MSDSHQTEQIVQLIAAYQRRLLIYIRSLIPARGDAEEILQEVTLFIWRNAHEFKLGTDFGAWAYKIAYFQVLACRKKMAREQARLSDTLVEQLAGECHPDEHEDLRRAALEQCVKKLPPEQRDLVKMRYHKEASMEALAEKLKRSVKTAYRLLNRIHMTLLDCVQQSLRTGGAP